MPKIEMYSSAWCPYCMAAQRLLKSKGVEFTTYSVDGQPAVRAEMTERTGRTSVPQIFVEGRSIGGFDDIAALDADGGLDRLLGPA